VYCREEGKDGRKEGKKGIKVVMNKKTRYTIRKRGSREVKNKIEKAKRQKEDKMK